MTTAPDACEIVSLANIGQISADLFRAVRNLLLIVAAIVLLLVGVLFVGANQELVEHLIYPSPNRQAALVIEASLRGGAAGSMVVEAYLVGAGLESETKIGTYFHQSPTHLDGWRDNGTVNICSLRGEADTKSSVRLRRADGTWAIYRITTECSDHDAAR